MNILKKIDPAEDYEVDILRAKFHWSAMTIGGDMPLDVTRCFIEKCKTYDGHRFNGSEIFSEDFCIKCKTPRIANLHSTKLIKPPIKNQAMKRLLLKKEKNPDRMSKKECIILTAFKEKLNTLVITCHVCNYKYEEYYSKPSIKSYVAENSPSEVVEQDTQKLKKKKKKRRKKDPNAGLLLNNTPIDENKLLSDKNTLQGVHNISSLASPAPLNKEKELEFEKKPHNNKENFTQKTSSKPYLGKFDKKKEHNRVEKKYIIKNQYRKELKSQARYQANSLKKAKSKITLLQMAINKNEIKNNKSKENDAFADIFGSFV